MKQNLTPAERPTVKRSRFNSENPVIGTQQKVLGFVEGGISMGATLQDLTRWGKHRIQQTIITGSS